MKKKILNIGSVTKDTIITQDNNYNQIGGAVFYQLSTLNKLKIPNDSIILIGENDIDLLNSIDDKNSIHYINKKNTMEYTNIYKDNKRYQKAYFPKDSIQESDIQQLNINLKDYSDVILSPLSPYEIKPDLIKYLKKAKLEITLVIQGYIRNIDNDNNIITTNWPDYEKYLRYTDIISSDNTEFEKAFNIEINDENMKKFINDHELKIVIITLSSEGSAIYTKNEKIKIPSIPTKKEVDFTGLGDTYISAFIAKKDVLPLFNAGLYASICAKNKLENKSCLKTSKNKIEEEYTEILNQISQNNKWNNNC